MKKTTIAILASGLLLVTGLQAQTLQEGVNHLYAGRVKSATGVFEKLLAVNPNNIEATYWLGQAYLENDEIMGARRATAQALYEKAAQSSNGAPLILVGLGHVELLENKVNEARQHFESALTMTRGKKGDDPVIETAIGRAITDAKGADYAYAVRLLEDAAGKDPKNLETLLQLGNAYRKAGQGNGGGAAYTTYLKALQVNPAFSVANLRLAKLFESQKNWDLVLQYLNDAITKDPKFTIGYYELFYYYFYRGKYPEAEEQLKKYIDSKLPDVDVQDQYLYAQLCWARKDFDCAVSKADAVVMTMGANTKPKVYRLMADAYFQKGDFANAKKYSDLFFVKKNPDDITLYDFQLRADILAKTGGTTDEIVSTYMQGAAIDTLANLKVDLLKKGVAYFKENKMRDIEAQLIQKIIELKPKPSINDYFDLTLAYYFSGNYGKSREMALLLKDKFPEEVYGFDWAFKNATMVDTLRQDSIAVPDALSLYEFAQKDTVKYKKHYISSVRYLAAYYINKARDKDKSLEFFRKWLSADTANAAMIQQYIDQIEKMQTKPGTKPATGNPKGTGKNKSPAVKTAVAVTKKAAAAPKNAAKG